MGDGAINSSGGGGGGRAGESVVIDHEKRRSSCGYCGSSGFSSAFHGLWARSITVDHYQDLLDRGWRRSGCFLYKPEMERTCCPSYTIRLKAGDFVPSKELVRVHRKMQRYLDDTSDTNKPERLKRKPNSLEASVDMAGSLPSTTIATLSGKGSSAGICKKMSHDDELINHLTNKIDEAIRTCVGSGDFPSTVEFPKTVVKRMNSQSKRKLVERAEDLLYTSSISFQIAAVIRCSHSAEENPALMGSLNLRRKELIDVSPNIVAEKLAYSIVQNGENSGLIIRACNGHLNFYSDTKQTFSLPSTEVCMRTYEGDNGECERTSSTHSVFHPFKRRKLEIRMKRSSFDEEEYALYRRYQIKVHNDKPDKVTESSYKRFLVDTPLIFVPPCDGYKTVPPCGFGSFHQQYLIDGKLVAVGVVDILPRCLSSKYLFWDPDFACLSLGKYSALQEIDWVKEVEVHCKSLQYYYLGYYIHSCRKMRYKAAYRPSELLCPLRYEWVPFDIAKPLLDGKPYVILSDYMALKDQALSSKLPNNSIEISASTDMDKPKEAFSDEDEEADLEELDVDVGSESDSEASCASYTDDLTASDIGNIMIDLNGSRVKFQDLQQVLGPIEKRHIKELEMQLLRYAKVVGKDLSNQIIYTPLGDLYFMVHRL